MGQTALDALITNGPIALGLGLLLGGLGVPVPATLMLLAAGALVRQNRLDGAVALVALAGAVSGDIGSYLMGRYGLRGLVARLEKGASWRRAEKTFDEKGAIAILLTRFFLTPLALPTNLIAGGERFPLAKFAAASVAGEVVWVLFYGGLGFVFASSWAAVGAQAGRIGGWLVAGAAALFGVYELWHWRGHLTPHKEEPAATVAGTGTLQ